MSIFLYAWYQRKYFIIVASLIILNYGLLYYFHRLQIGNKSNSLLGVLIPSINILIFIVFRGITSYHWFHHQIGEITFLAWINNLAYPLGLSFILFQILACYFETDRDPENFPTTIWDYSLYLLFFPKIILGPITRWSDFSKQLNTLYTRSSDQFNQGLRRFIIGFAKKILIADQLALLVNSGFNQPYPAYSFPIAWLVLISCFLQIYYDFSGYIDMGIGISSMLGITLPENFNHPYWSKSISEFWRRWHMTLTSWFRDFVFMPLEFKRRKKPIIRQEYNIILIFLLTGLWHGFTLNYLLWGIIQGILITFETSRYGKWLKRLPSIIQRCYFIFVVLISWVIFRSPTIPFAGLFLKRLIIFNLDFAPLPFSQTGPLPIVNPSTMFTLLIGLLFLFPVKNIMIKWFLSMQKNIPNSMQIFDFAADFIMVILFIISISFSASQAFIPSLYGKY